MGKVIAKEESFWLEDESTTTDFPLDAFPTTVQNIITDLNKSMNFAPEFTASAILCTTSVLIGNKVKLHVFGSWISPSHIYLLVVGGRGKVKSHPLEWVLKPLVKKEIKLSDDYREKKNIYDALENPSAEDLPIESRFMLDRFTPQKLFKVHKENPHGVMIYCDEAKEWFGTFNQYSKNAEENLYCKIHNGIRVSDDTVGGGTTAINEPCVTILGGIQPTEIIDFIRANTENGLVDRILFTYPDKLRRSSWPDKQMKAETTKNWEDIFEDLWKRFADPSINLERRIYEYTPEAFKILKHWESELIKKANSLESEIYDGVSAKAETNVHRLAISLNALNNIDKEFIEKIGVAEVEGAIKLANYFLTKSLNIYELASEKTKGDPMHIWFSFLPETEFKTQFAMDVGKRLNQSQRTVERYLKQYVEDGALEKVRKGFYTKIYQ